ncbi:hypothetical protein B0H13DRAFT_2342315 [Mycena leptocephala]|nr:hypothetical protein B0H13DRAFT_2342315 [Mycena leptocephala]
MSRLPGGANSTAARGPPAPLQPNNFSRGSHRKHPLLVDENGRVVDDLNRRPSPKRTPLRRLQIFEGPPSAINQLVGLVGRTRTAREEANDRPYSRAVARMRAEAALVASGSSAGAHGQSSATGWSKHTPIKIKPKGRNGFRAPRDGPLMEASLYLTAARPPADSSPLPHHECGICLNIKSHPVSNPCGHTHCYVCIRKCLETGWACPFCRAVITAEPTRNRDSEQAIAFDHPEWHDPSAVTYGWEGLRFPTH